MLCLLCIVIYPYNMNKQAELFFYKLISVVRLYMFRYVEWLLPAAIQQRMTLFIQS